MNLEENLGRHYVDSNNRTKYYFLDENSMLQPLNSEENAKYNLSEYKRSIDTLLQSETIISKGMRLFIADVLCGRIKIKKDGKVATLKRNLRINTDISICLAKGDKLTGENPASEKVANEYNISVESVIDAHKKAIKYYAEIESETDIFLKTIIPSRKATKYYLGKRP